MGAMRSLLAILFLASSVHAQSLADAARMERDRHAHVKPAQTITGTGSGAVAAPAAASAGPKTEQPKKPAIDPVKAYNEQLDRLRTSIRSLQDEETATQLEINQLNNQVYAPVIDQAAKDQALTVVGAEQQKLADIRKELEETRKDLEALQLQGPPKQ